MNENYALFCAGEDSGDILGALAVSAVAPSGILAIGIGGPRMQKAGLKSIGSFEDLAVSGFKDALTHYLPLRRCLNTLKASLKNPHCKAVVLIDYPGLNMRLVKLAKKYAKPILYIAPPQIWAWKPKRALLLRDVSLGVLFDFEKQAYENSGCCATKLEFPFLESAKKAIEQKQPKKEEVLLLPGSRRLQMRRNMPFFIKIVEGLQRKNPELKFKLVASRPSLLNDLQQPKIHGVESILVPEDALERACLFSSAKFIIAPPGSSVLESTLVGTPTLACSRIDFLTYILGSLLVRTRFFSLPNILLNKKMVPEWLTPASIFYKNATRAIVSEIEKINPEDFFFNISSLHKACEGQSIKSLTLEFLVDVANRDSK